METDAIECLTANLRCIGIGTPNAVVIVGFLSIDGFSRFYSPSAELKIIEVLKRFFEDESKIKAGHNSGYYDLIVMKQQLNIEVAPNIDTMLFHRLVASELPHNLGFVGSVYTDAPSWKTDRVGKKKALGGESDEDLHIYCGFDVAVTAAVVAPLWKGVSTRNQQAVSACDHQLQKICADMHTVGMHVDQVERKKWEQKFLKETYTRRDQIRSMAGMENLNPASVLQLRDLLFEQWRLDPPCDDKVGGPAMETPLLRMMCCGLSFRCVLCLTISVKPSLRFASSKGAEALGNVCDQAQIQFGRGMGGLDDEDSWLDKEWRDRYGTKKLGIVCSDTDRMYPGYNCHGTTSGRLSSSQPINAQNFPGSLRAMVTAAPGHILVGADADQLELRIAASRWHSEKYLSAFRQGLDPHSSVTAYAIFGARFEKAALDCGVGVILENWH